MPDPNPLRIVHVLRAPMGGLFRHVRDLALAHQSAGHHVGIVCDVAGTPGYYERMVSSLAEHLSLGIHRIPMTRQVGLSDLGTSRRALKVFKELQPDVLHGHGAKGGVYARAFGSLLRAGRSRVARFYSPHGGSLHYDPRSRAGRVYFLAERFLERMTERIIFVAEFEKAAYCDKVGTPRCRWLVNYNGLAGAEFEPVEPAADAIEFLFLGEMRLLKGPDLFLQAIASLRNNGCAARAVMVGDGPDRAIVERQIADLGLDGAVALRDPMPAREAFALARCFVMSSRAEAMPYVVLEALGAGMPVIATDVGGIPEIVGDGSPALVAPDADSLAAAMRTAMETPAQVRSWMPDAAGLRSRFSATTMAGNVLEAYQEALARSGSPRQV